MNGTEPEPLSADIVDELLSADLDGEFDAAARELGLDPSTARARIAVTPGSFERRAALARASAFVASDAGDTLDDVTRRRLVSRAIDGAVVHPAPSHRSRASIVRIAAVAGAAAVLAGLIVLLGHAGGDNSSKDSSAAAPVTAAAPGTPPTTVAPNATQHFSTSGTTASVDSGAQLNQFVQGLLQSNDALLPSGTQSNAPTTQSKDLNAERAEKTAAPSAGTCADRIAPALKIGSSPIASAPVRYRGQPAAVAVFRTANGPLAVVFAPANCTVLARQLVK